MNTNVARNYDLQESDFVEEKSKRKVERIMHSIRNFATVSEGLRILGASVLLVSMSVFLLQGWSDGNDVRRYLMLLTQTGLLAAAGFAMSYGLKEMKGARLFFGLALVSIPANFTILGALLYSVSQWDGALTTYPDFATWQIENVASTGITLAGAMLILLPITVFCFAIMARQSTRTLSLNFFVLNLLLLLPIRSSLAAGAIALVGTAYALYVVRKALGKDRALRTAEGKFALITLFIPAGIILFRSMYFYQVDSLMVAMLSLAVFLGARQASLFPERSARMAFGLDTLSIPVAMTFALAVTNAFGPDIAWAWVAPVFAMAYMLLALDVCRRTASRKLAKAVGISISFFVALSFVFGLAAGPSSLSALFCLLAGALMLMVGMVLGDRMAQATGALTMIASAMFGFDLLWALVIGSSWIDLAIFGALAIATGSLLDRHGVAINLRVANWFGSLREKQQAIALDD